MSASEPTPSHPPIFRSDLPLPLLHRGKVREMYDAGSGHLLMVASDRVSAFDVVMAEPVPRKGEVLTLLTAWWLEQLGDEVEHHLVAARPEEIARRVPALAGAARDWARRSLLVRRTRPLPIECVVRGYLSGSAWREYRRRAHWPARNFPQASSRARSSRPRSSPRPRRSTTATTRTSPSRGWRSGWGRPWPSGSASSRSRSMGSVDGRPPRAGSSSRTRSSSSGSRRTGGCS